MTQPPFDEWQEAFFTPEQMTVLRQLNAEPEKIWRNSRYQVLVRKAGPDSKGDGWPDTIHLSIRRLDREPIHDWRDLQRIKNELVGPEHEAVELYPTESRVQDGANQYHLWVMADPKVKVPLGWQGLKHDGPSLFGEKQRPFEDKPTMTPSDGPPNETLEAYKKRVSEEAAESTKSKYIYADMHVENYMKLRKGLLEILDLHPLHDGYFHKGSATGPRACKMDEIDEYILENLQQVDDRDRPR